MKVEMKVSQHHSLVVEQDQVATTPGVRLKADFTPDQVLSLIEGLKKGLVALGRGRNQVPDGYVEALALISLYGGKVGVKVRAEKRDEKEVEL